MIGRDNADELGVAWYASFGSSGEPVVANGFVYASNLARTEAYPVDCRTDGGRCEPVWQAVSGLSDLEPAVRGRWLFQPSITEGIDVFDTVACAAAGGTCSPTWTASLGATAQTSPVIDDGVVFIGAGSQIMAFPAAGCGAATCAPSWTAPTGSLFRSMLAADRGVVVATMFERDDSHLVAFDADGCGAATCSQLWDIRFRGDTGFNSPAIVGQQVLGVLSPVGMVAFPLAGCGGPCHPTWTGVIPPDGTSTPAVLATNGQLAYVVNQHNQVSAFRVTGCGAHTCAPLWSGQPDLGLFTEQAAGANGVLWSAAWGTDEIFAVDATDGSLLHTYELGDAGESVSVGAGAVFVTMVDRLLALRPSGSDADPSAGGAAR